MSQALAELITTALIIAIITYVAHIAGWLVF